MRRVSMIIGASALAVLAYILGEEAGANSTAHEEKSPGFIVSENEGERREFRTRPGTFFTLKVDAKNGHSKQMVVMTEDMAPGDRIPTHRHPNADELILIRTGNAKVILGDRNLEVHAGDIIFVPRDTWIGAENVGPEHLTLASVYSSPGYEEYLRSVSVVAGQPVMPLSQEE